jgi:hypothetical protein
MPLVSIVGIAVGYENSPSLFWMSIVSVLSFVFVIAWLYQINGAPLIFVVFSPIGAVVVAYMLWSAASMLKNRIPICWGGREYILEPRAQ